MSKRNRRNLPVTVEQLFVTVLLPCLLSTAHAAGKPDVAGAWRIYSARLYYDKGGGGAVDTTAMRTLQLRRDGKWQYGSSRGTWSSAAISAADWNRWGIKSYGPKQKLVLKNWNKSQADGPIEQSTRVDFLWAFTT